MTCRRGRNDELVPPSCVLLTIGVRPQGSIPSGVLAHQWVGGRYELFGKSGKVTTRRVKPKNKPVDLTKSSSASPAGSHNDLNIADVHVGDKLTHDHFGLGTVIETQDKGMNSVITVDFGNGEVKRLLLRMAPIEML